MSFKPLTLWWLQQLKGTKCMGLFPVTPGSLTASSRRRALSLEVQVIFQYGFWATFPTLVIHQLSSTANTIYFLFLISLLPCHLLKPHKQFGFAWGVLFSPLSKKNDLPSLLGPDQMVPHPSHPSWSSILAHICPGDLATCGSSCLVKNAQAAEAR